MLAYCFIVFGCLIRSSMCNPIDLKQLDLNENAYKYLKQFGYLGSGQSESQYGEKALENALKQLQKYGNINQTGIVDAATLKLMETPRCGVKDIANFKTNRRKRYILGPGGWNKRNLTYFVANWSPKIGKENVEKDMRKAFNIWAPYGNLRFSRTLNPDADIIIGFGSGYHGDYYPFDGRGNILAHAYYPYEMGAYGGDIHFDDDEQWTSGADYNPDEGDVDFLSVAVHELGHSLGLAHSPVPDSVMFPFYRWSKDYVQLGYDDILAMHRLYIARVFHDTVSTSVPDKYDEYDEDSDVEIITEISYPNNSPSTSEKTEAITQLDTTTITYNGDYETVDDHKEHEKNTSKVAEVDSILCNGSIDAIALIENELYIIKDQFLWKMRFLGQHLSDFPVKFNDYFLGLPQYINKIDALYERPTDKAVILFSGKQYWIFNRNIMIDGPRAISDYGISPTVEKIDAIQVWKKNGKTYIYQGDHFWRYDEENKKLDENYPKSMERWRGIPTNLDAALTWANGLTYFFKGYDVWRFDNYRIRVDEAFPQLAIYHWFGCSRNTKHNV